MIKIDETFKNMKDNIPDTPNDIHNMIINKVSENTTPDNIVNIRQKRNGVSGFRKFAGVAGMCLMVSSIGAGVSYAAVNIVKSFDKKIEISENKDDNSISVGVSDVEQVEETEYKLPETIGELNYVFNYVPENMNITTRNYLGTNDAINMGISVNSVLLDDKSVKYNVDEYNVEEKESFKVGDYDALYIKYKEDDQFHEYGKRIYLVRPDLYRMIIVSIGETIPKDEAIKVVSNLDFTQNNEKLNYTSDLMTWSIYTNNDPYTSANTSIDINKVDIKNKNDILNGHVIYDGFNVKINDIKIVDNNKELDPEYITDDFEKAFDENGNLIDKKVVFYSDDTYKAFPDNVTLKTIKDSFNDDSLSEESKNIYTSIEYDNYIRKYIENNHDIVSRGLKIRGPKLGEFYLKQKLVLINLTFTNDHYNTLNYGIDEISFLPQLSIVEKYNGKYHLNTSSFINYNSSDHRCSNDEYIEESGYSIFKPPYFDFERYKDANGWNTFKMLEKGESITITVGYIVNECDLNDLYLSVSGYICEGQISCPDINNKNLELVKIK